MYKYKDCRACLSIRDCHKFPHLLLPKGFIGSFLSRSGLTLAYDESFCGNYKFTIALRITQ